MVTLAQRIAALEKIIADRTPVEPRQIIVMDIERDAPEEYERKRLQIEALEATGQKVIVFSVVDARE